MGWRDVGAALLIVEPLTEVDGTANLVSESLKLRLRVPLWAGSDVIVKVTLLLQRCPTDRVMGPEVAEPGTGTVICVSLQEAVGAGVPLKRTTLEPWVSPKPLPCRVTRLDATPDIGVACVSIGATPTPKLYGRLAIPLDVTTTPPVVAPAGIVTIMLLFVHVVGVADTPWNVTAPGLSPNPDPVIVVVLPIVPVFGIMVAIRGIGITVKVSPEVVSEDPLTTVTGPLTVPFPTVAMIVESFHVLTMACTPPIETVPVAWAKPKPLPEIVTDEPTVPEVGDTPVRVGGFSMVRETGVL
jgi:hypothetical protein